MTSFDPTKSRPLSWRVVALVAVILIVAAFIGVRLASGSDAGVSAAQSLPTTTIPSESKASETPYVETTPDGSIDQTAGATFVEFQPSHLSAATTPAVNTTVRTPALLTPKSNNIAKGVGNDDNTNAKSNEPIGKAPETPVVTIPKLEPEEDQEPAATCGGLTVTIFGTSGDDVIEGTWGDDVIHAGGGNDIINGLGGNDIICGGPGDDVIDGSYGTDIIYGGSGNDVIYGSYDADVIYGGDGNDNIYGGFGTDTIDGGAGDDEIHGEWDADFIDGGDGDDYITGGFGTDELHGGSGDDYINGGHDADIIFGGDGNDELWGEFGTDEIHGGAGDDIIDGGPDADRLFGNEGNDTIYGQFGTDHIEGGPGYNIIDGGPDTDFCTTESGVVTNCELPVGGTEEQADDSVARPVEQLQAATPSEVSIPTPVTELPDNDKLVTTDKVGDDLAQSGVAQQLDAEVLSAN